MIRAARYALLLYCLGAVPICAQRTSSTRGDTDVKIHGSVQYYISAIDGEKRPYAFCATDESPTPKPLILEVSPGASNLEASVQSCENIAQIAAAHGRSCLVLRPTSRGPGTVNQNYGEVDTLEAIRDVINKWPVDPQRITITGGSMGGAATWYLTSHNPDLFAAGAPFCGYCDYRLWEKPGGLTFHMNEWEEPSWQARSGVLLIENFIHTPMWITHGEWDRSVGGGVPVEQSREMARLLREAGFTYSYHEVPKTGHNCRTGEYWENAILWLLDQKKVKNPTHVELATYELRHNKSYWVTIAQLAKYGGVKAVVDARVDGGTLAVKTTNVRTLALGPIDDAGNLDVRIDEQDVGSFDMSAARMFRREGDNWQAGDFDMNGEKRHGCAGPITDLFCENTVMIVGTRGNDAEDNFLSLVAGNARGYFKSRNGGVHRGGIMGNNDVDLPMYNDTELPEGYVEKYNLLLYGNYNTNAILKKFEGRLPLKFNADSIEVCGKTFTGDRIAVFAVFPNPDNPDRYVAVHGGSEPDAITWGSHLDMMLLPDYLVYNRGKTVAWGFWSNNWRD